MGAVADYLAVLQDDDLVRVQDGADSLGDEDAGDAGGLLLQNRPQLPVVL